MRSIVFVFAAALTGCATHYAYVPVSPPVVTVAEWGRTAASYSIPQASPHGDLRVVSYGVETLASGDPSDSSSGEGSFSTIHVRLIVGNMGEKPWTVDTREQQIVLEGYGAEPVAFAAANRTGDASQPPLIHATRGVMRIVDLFFPLPGGIDQAVQIPAFQVLTKVHMDEGDVDETTPFQRIEVDATSAYAMDDSEPQDSYNPDVYGYDYWDDPFWFNGGFVGFRGVHMPHVGVGRVYARGSGWGRPGYYHGAGRGGGGGRGGHGGGGGGGGHGHK